MTFNLTDLAIGAAITELRYDDGATQPAILATHP
jgi:hypothetical protein